MTDMELQPFQFYASHAGMGDFVFPFSRVEVVTPTTLIIGNTEFVFNTPSGRRELGRFRREYTAWLSPRKKLWEYLFLLIALLLLRV